MLKKITGNILFENGTIFDPFNNKKIKGSILISNGIIKGVGKISIPKKVNRINCKGKIIAPGFIDIHAHFREPG